MPRTRPVSIGLSKTLEISGFRTVESPVWDESSGNGEAAAIRFPCIRLVADYGQVRPARTYSSFSVPRAEQRAHPVAEKIRALSSTTLSGSEISDGLAEISRFPWSKVETELTSPP